MILSSAVCKLKELVSEQSWKKLLLKLNRDVTTVARIERSQGREKRGPDQRYLIRVPTLGESKYKANQ